MCSDRWRYRRQLSLIGVDHAHGRWTTELDPSSQSTGNSESQADERHPDDRVQRGQPRQRSPERGQHPLNDHQSDKQR